MGHQKRSGLLSACICCLCATVAFSQPRAKLELPYQGGMLTIEADRLVRDADTRWTAEGTVVVSYRDTTLKAARLTYNPVTEEAVAEGNMELSRGVQWLKGSRAELNLKTDTGILYNVEGYTDEQFFLRAKKLLKTGPDAYVAEGGFLTACSEAVPKWSFTVGSARIQLDATARLKHTLFRVKKIPVFYFPYAVVPTSRKARSSGFMLPTTGNSSNKGRRLGESFYLVLGRSADVMLHGDYFSQRGFGYGFTFRTQPNQVSRLLLDGYLVDDRKGQGGASINGIGETRFANGFRGVADFNLVSSFIFRQVFSDNFYAATRPTENSRLFFTNNFRANSVNFLLSREETVFPGRNVVIRNTPVFNFKILGQRFPQTPLYVDLDASAEGLSRADRLIETPGIIQRLDFFPQAYFSLPLVQGLRLTPRIGIRETFYSDSLKPGENFLSGTNIRREYVEFSADLKGWGLSRIYTRGSGAGWKHLIEPVFRYRYIGGIRDFDRIVRFDERDAVANTNEIEYAVFHRFFVKRQSGDGYYTQEWLSVKLGQKYFFDSDFGGALQPDSMNQFFPLNTFTGFPYAGIPRDASPVTGLVRFAPEPRISFDVRGDFDTKFRQFRNFSVTGFWNQERFSVGASYFVMQKLEAGTFQNQQLQAQLTAGNLQRGLSASTAFSYDAETARFLNSLSRVNYVWDCCGVSLEYQRFDLGVRQERQLRFSFFLKGIGAFGTIKRPEGIFPGSIF